MSGTIFSISNSVRAAAVALFAFSAFATGVRPRRCRLSPNGFELRPTRRRLHPDG
jgi:hypothetical protein